MQTFTWCPRVEPEGQYAYRVHTAQFGDGYKQEVGDGINNEVQTWPLEFRGKVAYIQPIRDFLRAHAGFRPFLWTPPMGVEGAYAASGFTLQPMGAGSYVLSTTFEQRFEP